MTAIKSNDGSNAGQKDGEKKKRKGERFSDDTICTDHLHSGLKERKGREEGRKKGLPARYGMGKNV